MKFVTFRSDDYVGFGAIRGQGIVDLRRRLGHADLKAFLGSGAHSDAEKELKTASSPDFSCAAVRLLPPIPNPNKILCVGLNYRDHLTETKLTEYPYPVLFSRFADTLVAHGDSIWRPRNSTSLDFEGELLVIIGRGGRHIDEAKALEHVGGYACFNDASLRDWQFHTNQHLTGKNFPRTGGFGPWLVTPDEVDLKSAYLYTRLNGVQMQSAAIASQIFTLKRLISYCSAFTPLSPGDLISTGTPSGIGNRRNPKIFMKPGDTIEIEITGVGKLINTIADEPRVTSEMRSESC